MDLPADWPRGEKQPDLDLGDGHYAFWTRWDVDFSIEANVERFGRFRSQLPVERAGLLLLHRQLRSETGWCMGGITFDLPPLKEVFGERAVWQVHSLEPLTLSPSLLCSGSFGMKDGQPCGDHGFIREGRWIRA